MDRRSWFLLLVLAAIWGASYMLIEIAIRDLSPAMVAWTRIALAAVVLVGLAAARGALRGMGTRWRALALVGAVQVAGPFVLIGAGQEEISSSLAGILVTSAPLFTALLAIRVDHEERSHGYRLVGVMLGFVGVVVLLGLDLSGSGDELLGGLAVVLASFGYAVGGFIVKHRLAEPQPIGVAAWVMTASVVILAPAAVIGSPEQAPGLGPAAAVIGLGVVGTGIAFAIFYSLIARVGPARAFIVTYLVPGFAVVYGATLLDESITLATLVGLALILVGSWLAAEGRLGRLGRAAEPERPFDAGVPEPAPVAPRAEASPGALTSRPGP
jgi:drug/metabolite transporter (DMT)-like permease